VPCFALRAFGCWVAIALEKHEFGPSPLTIGN